MWSVVQSHTIRYDTRSYFNVHSKTDISQLNLPHGTKLKKWKREKLKSKKTDILRSIGIQSGESMESVLLLMLQVQIYCFSVAVERGEQSKQLQADTVSSRRVWLRSRQNSSELHTHSHIYATISWLLYYSLVSQHPQIRIGRLCCLQCFWVSGRASGL